MPHELPQQPSLADFQNHIQAICTERGWDKNNAEQVFLLFVEEVGELAKGIRKEIQLYAKSESGDRENLREEFADVFNYLLDLANRFDIDLEAAYRQKEQKNRGREW